MLQPFDPRRELRRLHEGEPILLVAEPAELRSVMRGMLRAVGCSEIVDCDARHALALLREQSFALVVSDIAAQGMDGFELLRAIRGEASLSGLPFVLVTAEPTQAMVLAAKRLGVDGCLAKPFTLAMLTRQITLALRRNQVEAPAATAADSAELRAGIAVLMRMIERRLASAELRLDEDTLLLLRSYLERAGELGLGQRYAIAFDSLCAALRASLDPTQQARPPVLRPVGAPEKEGALMPTPRRELRRSRRFTAPALQVAMLGHPYRTVDWSAGGIAVAHYAGTLTAGRAIEATIRMEGGGPAAAMFREPLLIVRNNTATGRLSARFPARSWTGLKLMEQLIHRRLGSEEGGVAA